MLCVFTEQQLAHGASQKLKELRQELTSERQKYGYLQKQSDEKMAQQKQEIEALHNRMMHTHEQHHAEINGLKMNMEQVQGQVNEGQVAYVQRLEEENVQLKEANSQAQYVLTMTITRLWVDLAHSHPIWIV